MILVFDITDLKIKLFIFNYIVTTLPNYYKNKNKYLHVIQKLDKNNFLHFCALKE